MQKIYKLIIICICLVLISGCVKNTNTMTINKDKSMTYEGEILLSDSLQKSINNYVDTEDLKNRKFTVNTSMYEGYTGVNISKSFDNIDELSTEISNEKVMSNFFEKDFDEKEMFKRDKGFFKDTYTAKFKYTINQSAYDVTVEEEEEAPSEVVTQTETTENELQPSNITDDQSDLSELNQNAKLRSEMEFIFKLKLPYASVSNNATEVSDDERVLTWKLDPNGDTAISFTFYILNMTHIYIVGGIGLLLLIGLITFIIILIKKKANEETLIHIDYDESIASKVENDIMNAPVNLEISLPEENPDNQKMEVLDVSPDATFYDKDKIKKEEEAKQLEEAKRLEGEKVYYDEPEIEK